MNANLHHWTQRARITGPVPYRDGSGRQVTIPIGPCMVEGLGNKEVDVIWGSRGQSSVVLPMTEARLARDHGHLVLLD